MTERNYCLAVVWSWADNWVRNFCLAIYFLPSMIYARETKRRLAGASRCEGRGSTKSGKLMSLKRWFDDEQIETINSVKKAKHSHECYIFTFHYR